MADDPITWGVLPEGLLERVLVCSPHFDDAALGAAHLLFAHPGSVVVTVFGGPPDEYPDPPSEWDALGGFQAGDDVVALRRDEDDAAMKVLDARPVWLDFVDYQYLQPEQRPTNEQVASEIAGVVDEERPTAVFLPMGIANPDHVSTHEGGVLVAAERDDVAWFCYEDSGYKHIPGMLAWRVVEALPFGSLAHADDRADRRRPRAQARRRRVLRLPARAAQPRPRVGFADRRERPRAVLAAGAAAPRLGAPPRRVTSEPKEEVALDACVDAQL